MKEPFNHSGTIESESLRGDCLKLDQIEGTVFVLGETVTVVRGSVEEQIGGAAFISRERGDIWGAEVRLIGHIDEGSGAKMVEKIEFK